MYVCPITRQPLVGFIDPDGRVYPLLDGIPVLVPHPEAFLARHGPDWSAQEGLPTGPREPLPIDAPDPVTPHLPVGQQILDHDPASGDLFHTWITTLGDGGPDAVCARWAGALAPAGPSLDAGCGVGPMARRMAHAGREVWAFDRSPRAVILARALLTGRVHEAGVPTHRGGYRPMKVPFEPFSEATVHLAIADVRAPPYADEAFAWVHVGNLLDMADADPEELLAGLWDLLAPGGLLTLSTPYDTDETPLFDAPGPEARLLESLEALDLTVLEQDLSVPWVVREYDRGYRVLFTHCVAARKG